MKYVVVSAITPSKKPGQEPSVIRYPFVFPNNLVHAHVGKVASLLISFMHLRADIKITSAGDVNSADFTGECSGESESLGVKSATGDTNLLRMNDYGAGMLEM